MGADWNVEDLEIVGYATVLKDSMLPSIVAPVFRLRSDPGRIFLPPYSFNAGLLRNATEVAESELKELSDAREITVFEEELFCRPGFELWIDQGFGYHYEPREVVNRKLRSIADEAIAQATEALRRGDRKQAERLSGIAMSADDRRVEPLAIKAAIRRLNEKPGADLMAELAEPFIGRDMFNALVDEYVREDKNHPPPLPPACATHPPIWQMASHKAA